MFSTVPYDNINRSPINNLAQVYTESIITDSINWTTISGSFIADSAYSFISIGNFFDSTNTQVIDYNNNYPSTYAAYYYVDDIKVSSDSLFVIGMESINQELFSVYPNPSGGDVYVQSHYSGEFAIEIYNLIGELVYTAESEGPYHLDLHHLISGLYFLNVKKDEQHYFSHKLLIRK